MNVGKQKSSSGRLQRVNYGKGHGYKLDGAKIDGVTSILNGAVPKPALVGWAAKAVAAMAFDDPAAFETLKRVGRDAFLTAAAGIPFNERDLAANKGTEVHKLAEQIGIGEEVEVPDYLEGHVQAYLEFRELWAPTDEVFEVSCFNLKYRYGGTLDSWAHIEALKATKNPWTGRPMCECDDKCLTLLDNKTNRSGPFGEVGLQLAAYDLCDLYIDAAGEEREMPTFAHHAVLWLRSDGFDLIPFDVTDADRKAFLYAQQVARWNNWKEGRSGKIKGSPLDPPRGAQGHLLRE